MHSTLSRKLRVLCTLNLVQAILNDESFRSVLNIDEDFPVHLFEARELACAFHEFIKIDRTLFESPQCRKSIGLLDEGRICH